MSGREGRSWQAVESCPITTLVCTGRGGHPRTVLDAIQDRRGVGLPAGVEDDPGTAYLRVRPIGEPVARRARSSGDYGTAMGYHHERPKRTDGEHDYRWSCTDRRCNRTWLKHPEDLPALLDAYYEDGGKSSRSLDVSWWSS